MKICFLTKKEKPYVEEAINYLSKISKKIDIYDGSSTRDFPLEILDKKYDIVIKKTPTQIRSSVKAALNGEPMNKYNLRSRVFKDLDWDVVYTKSRSDNVQFSIIKVLGTK